MPRMFGMCPDVFASAAELHQVLSFVGGGGDKGGDNCPCLSLASRATSSPTIRLSVPSN